MRLQQQPLGTDEAAIIEVIQRLTAALDVQDWEGARRCLADALDTDYSSFRGTPAERLSAEAYLARRRTGLAGLRTEHRTTNHQVTVEGGRAVCRADFAIYRWPATGPTERFFHSYGSYTYVLGRAATGWRIVGITQVVSHNEGDPTLHGAFPPIAPPEKHPD
jgi:hypothetical protein